MLPEQFSSSWVAVCVAFSDLFNRWNRFKLMTTGHYTVKLQLAQYEQHMTQGAKINATLHFIFHGTQWGRTLFKCCKLSKRNKATAVAKAVITILRFLLAVLHFIERVPLSLSGCWLLRQEGIVRINTSQTECCQHHQRKVLFPVRPSSWHDCGQSRAFSLYWWQQVRAEPLCVLCCPKGLPACWNKALCKATKSNRWTNEQ